MKSKLATFFAATFLLLSCQGQTNKSVKTLTVEDYSKTLEATSNPQLIDVRTPQEFAEDHIGTAQNMNWNSSDFVANVEKLDKSKPVFVYCKVGGRSSQAASKLAELGFTEIYNLDGGIMKWNAVGKTISAEKTDKIIGICDQEYNEFIASNEKVVVNFYAEWCAPCKKMAPYMTKLETELKDKITLKRFDADKNKTIVDFLKLDSLPVVIIYENGKEIWRNIGFLSEEELKKHL
jgi:thioredoxin